MITSSKALNTSTFRLVAIYLIFFALSVCAVLAYVFWNTVGLLERQTDDTIRAEVQGLSDQYRILGLRGIADVINRRVESADGSIYLMVNPEGARIAGNIDTLPLGIAGDAGWIDFPINIGKNRNLQNLSGRAYHATLSGNYTLLVGQNVEELRQFGLTIRRAVTWALGLALVLGVGGGYLLSRNFLRRIDAITDTSRTIMAGDFTQRMPVSGSGDELDRLAQSLNDMLAQIERLMAGMKEVSSNVAHDLKTPLTRMRARVESALRSTNTTEHKAALEHTIEESDQLLKTFNALLSIARAEAGHARENFIDVDAADIVRDVVELYEPIVEDEGGTLTSTVAPSLLVRADRQLMAQALSNLIDNALKYGSVDGHPKLDVSATLQNEMVIITVSDNGSGIAEKDRSRVLDRFVRLDESRTKPGNGLGLSLVASVLKLHGGTLELVDANPGLKAILTLPLKADPR